MPVIPVPSRRDRLEPRRAAAGAHRYAAERYWPRPGGGADRAAASIPSRRRRVERSGARLDDGADRGGVSRRAADRRAGAARGEDRRGRGPLLAGGEEPFWRDAD